MVICPACAGVLAAPTGAVAAPAPAYRCESCGRAYPIEDDIAVLTPPDSGPAGYDAERIELVEAMARDHFWFRARGDLIVDALRAARAGDRPRVLEVGCGFGAVLSRLVAEGMDVEGADLLPAALRRCRAHLSVPLWLVDARRLPFVDEFDAIGLFDALEHVDDEAAVLRGVARSLRPGGVVVVTVPALPGLWSQLDVLARHQRRYTKRALVAAVSRAGLEVVRATYFNASLVPAMWLRRIWGRLRASDGTAMLRTPGPVVNAILYRVLDAERRLIRRGYELGVGASVMLIARRR
jgi:SAM-dependent methyltransferase